MLSWEDVYMDICDKRFEHIGDLKNKAEVAADSLRSLITQKNEVWLDGGMPFFYQKDKDIILSVIDVLGAIKSF